MKANYRIRVRAVAYALLLALLLAVAALPAAAEVTYPAKTEDKIADEAGILSESTVKYLRDMNETLNKEVHTVISICTVKTTDGVNIGKYARGLYENWSLPAGILIVIATEDEDFYLLPSKSVSETIGAEALEAIRDEYIEADFGDKQYDRAVKKAITQLSSTMRDKLKPADPAAAQPDASAEQTAEKSSAGSTIVKVLKIILIVVLVLVALFVILFVAALFNDSAAAFMQKYIFRRGKNTHAQNQRQYYDERLYGDDNPPRQRREPPANRPQNPGANRPARTANPSMRQNPNAAPGQVYYNADGTVRTPAARRNTGYAQNPQAEQNSRYAQLGQGGSYGQNSQYGQSGQYGQNSQYGRPYPQNGRYAQNTQYAQNGQTGQTGQSGQYARTQAVTRPTQQTQPQSQPMDGNATRSYTIVPRNDD